MYRFFLFYKPKGRRGYKNDWAQPNSKLNQNL
jgi:hypothetical protein